jgi:hypothetical protein
VIARRRKVRSEGPMALRGPSSEKKNRGSNIKNFVKKIILTRYIEGRGRAKKF